MKSKLLTVLTLACILTLGDALNCYVGMGNSSDKLWSENDFSLGGDPPTEDPIFVEKECGQPGSQLVNIETVMKNITERIKDSWGKLAEKATQWAGSLTGSNDRRKRYSDFLERIKREDQNATSGEEVEGSAAEAEAEPEAEAEAEPEVKVASEDENYACVKAMAGGVVFRSCVPKFGIIRLNCTSTIEQNVLCYCHTDGCNGSSQTKFQVWILPILMGLAYFTSR